MNEMPILARSTQTLPPAPSACALAQQNTAGTSHSSVPFVPSAQRTRNGKVARLPKHLRDLVNRLLRNNVPYSRIAKALAEHQIFVTERNISNWKICGGYQEWVTAQERALELRLHQDNLLHLLRKDCASDLPELGLQVAATRLSEFFLSPEAAQLLTSNPDAYHRRAATLARLTREIHKLQQYRDDSARDLGYSYNPHRIRADSAEKVEEAAKRFGAPILDESKKANIVPHRNYIPES